MLIFNALEEVVVFELRKVIANDYLYTLVVVLILIIGFGFIGNWLAPHLSKAVEKGHKRSSKTGGKVGIISFFLIIFLLIYWIFFVIYIKGPAYFSEGMINYFQQSEAQ